jgi:pimeloyl-ACP methyl ester carboxylesterase
MSQQDDKARKGNTSHQVQHHVTAVLVHGAWADGSSWNKVSAGLQRRGFPVVAAQIPLTSFSDDVAALRRILRAQDGPVVLAGHSYGCAVTTAAAAGDPNVKALVCVAAIAPDEGETVGELFHRGAPHSSAPRLAPDQDGFLWLKVDAFRNAVAEDASAEAGLEGKAVLVFISGRRSHDFSRYAALYSGKNESKDSFSPRGPYSLGFAS